MFSYLMCKSVMKKSFVYSFLILESTVSSEMIFCNTFFRLLIPFIELIKLSKRITEPDLVFKIVSPFLALYLHQVNLMWLHSQLGRYYF